MAGTHCAIDAVTALEEHNAKKLSNLGDNQEYQAPKCPRQLQSMADGKPQLFCAYSAAVQIVDYG
ncbi:hypothetical protein N7465_007813 [Penicillium sp. CMV-2018d]|nr:hypothetical protein N7465_007813 [Penicillium sp. CMV-2018d]